MISTAPIINEQFSTKLTPKETQIAKLIFIKRSSKDVAATLGISHKTVEQHLFNIRLKLNESQTFSAVLKAYFLGLLEFNE